MSISTIEFVASLETSRLILRHWKKEDFLPFRQINADRNVMEYYPAPLTAPESDAIVERAMSHFSENGFGLYAVELKKTGSFIGFIGLQRAPIQAHFTPAIELGWRIASEHWSHGYATEGAKDVLAFAFQELKIPQVVAMAYKGNLRSIRVMEKLGMTYDPRDDFENPHPQLKGTWLSTQVLYRISNAK